MSDERRSRVDGLATKHPADGKIDRSKCCVWSVNGVWILAECGHDARQVYDAQYGRQSRYEIHGIKRGFSLAYEGETPFNATEREFVDHVEVYSGGIVCR